MGSNLSDHRNHEFKQCPNWEFRFCSDYSDDNLVLITIDVYESVFFYKLLKTTGNELVSDEYELNVMFVTMRYTYGTQVPKKRPPFF